MAMPPPPPAPLMSQTRLEDGFRPGGPPPDDTVSGFVVFMNVTNTVTHLLLGAVAFCAFICINMTQYLSSEIFSIETPKVSAHVYLTVIGYVILMSQALLSLSPRSGWANNFKYPQKTKLYWALQVLGSLLAVIGGIIAVISVAEREEITIIPPTLPPPFPTLPEVTLSGSNHLGTAHQIVGFVALLLTTVSLVGGFAHLLCSNMVNNSMLKAIQSCAVTLTLIIAYLAILLAFHEFRDTIYDASVNMAISFTLLVILGMITMIIGNMKVGGKMFI